MAQLVESRTRGEGVSPALDSARAECAALQRSERGNAPDSCHTLRGRVHGPLSTCLRRLGQRPRLKLVTLSHMAGVGGEGVAGVKG